MCSKNLAQERATWLPGRSACGESGCGLSCRDKCCKREGGCRSTVRKGEKRPFFKKMCAFFEVMFADWCALWDFVSCVNWLDIVSSFASSLGQPVRARISWWACSRCVFHVLAQCGEVESTLGCAICSTICSFVYYFFHVCIPCMQRVMLLSIEAGEGRKRIFSFPSVFYILVIGYCMRWRSPFGVCQLLC